jgi:Domain of unknown function (DUF4149)
MPAMERLLQIVLGAWFGSLWTVCAVVAPSLFSVIPDRQLAGQVAGHFFTVATWGSLAFGSVALVLMKLRSSAAKFDYFLIAATVLAPLVSEIVLRPVMAAARTSENMQLFGILHGVSALLFGIACIAATVALWRALSPPRVAA